MDKDKNDVCPAVMQVDLTEEEIASAVKVCNKSELTSDIDQSKIQKNAMIDDMLKCIQDMDQCIMDMSSTSLKAECGGLQSDYEAKQDEKVDDTAEGDGFKNLWSMSMTGDRSKKSSVNDDSPPLAAKENQLNAARHRCEIPSPQSMSHINKEASKVINNLNTSFMFEENVFLIEEIDPVPINFDLDNSDSEDNLSNTEENICGTGVMNNETSISVGTESVDKESGINNPEFDREPEDNVSSIEENICETDMINNKNSMTAQRKDISVGTESVDKESGINIPEFDREPKDNLSSIEENICETDVINNKNSMTAQRKDISVGTESVDKESGINIPEFDREPKDNVSSIEENICETDVINNKNSMTAQTKDISLGRCHSEGTESDDSTVSSEYYFCRSEFDDISIKENQHNEKMKTEVAKTNQKHGNISKIKSSSNLKIGARETLKNLSNVHQNITGTDCMIKLPTNISNKSVIPTHLKPSIKLQEKVFHPEPLSHGKKQVKKPTSAMKPGNEEEITQSRSFLFPSKSELNSKLQNQPSTTQEISRNKPSGLMKPKFFSQKGSAVMPSKCASIDAELDSSSEENISKMDFTNGKISIAADTKNISIVTGKAQLKKTVSAIEAGNASEIIQSGLINLPSTGQETSRNKPSGLIPPKFFSQKSSDVTPSRSTPIKTVPKHHSTPGMSRIPRAMQTGSRLSFSKSLQVPGRNFYSLGSGGVRQPNPICMRKSEPTEEKSTSQNITSPKPVGNLAAASTSRKRTRSRLSTPSPLPAALNRSIARQLFSPYTKK